MKLTSEESKFQSQALTYSIPNLSSQILSNSDYQWSSQFIQGIFASLMINDKDPLNDKDQMTVQHSLS